MSRKIFTNCGNLLLIWAFSRDDRWARRRSRRRCPTADRCLAGCGGREGREGQMRANDGERAKNVRSRKRGSGTRSARAHRRRKRGGRGFGRDRMPRSEPITESDAGEPPASERRRLGCAREAARRRTGAGRPSLRARVDPGFVAGFDGNPLLRSRIRASVREGISVSAGQSIAHEQLGEERQPSPFSDCGFP